MKSILKPNLLIFYFCLFIFIVCCSGEKTIPGSGVVFSGVIQNSKNFGLDSAKIELNGTIVYSDADGKFRIASGKTADRYVLNLSRPGYGFVSKVFKSAMNNLTIRMAKATEQTIDLGKLEGNIIRVTDVDPEMMEPVKHEASPVSPLSAVPFVYDANGVLIDFQMPTNLANEYSGINRDRSRARGAQVEMEKDALELSEGNRVIEVSIQTIDTYSPDGMPGDNSVALSNGCSGFMRSFGAVNFEIKQNGRDIKLKKGKRARVIIPVDTLSFLSGALAETIPFLTYDRDLGQWKEDGQAVLNKTKTAYEAFTNHFSTFNMDMVFGANATCYQVCNQLPTTVTNPKIEISAPYYHLFNFGASECDCPGGGGAHVITNMGAYSPCGVRIFDGTTLLSTYVFVAGAPRTPGACPYSCSDVGARVDVTGTIDNNYVCPSLAGMCNIQLASPQRTTTGAAASFPIRLAWLYEQTFSASTTISFKIEKSLDGSAWTVEAASYASPEELIHHFDLQQDAGTTFYYRISRTSGGNPSNSVCLTLDNFGTADISNCPAATLPAAACGGC